MLDERWKIQDAGNKKTQLFSAIFGIIFVDSYPKFESAIRYVCLRISNIRYPNRILKNYIQNTPHSTRMTVELTVL